MYTMLCKQIYWSGFWGTISFNVLDWQIQTVETANGMKVDQGAAWIHGIVGNPLFHLAHRLGLTIRKVADGKS